MKPTVQMGQIATVATPDIRRRDHRYRNVGRMCARLVSESLRESTTSRVTNGLTLERSLSLAKSQHAAKRLCSMATRSGTSRRSTMESRSYAGTRTVKAHLGDVVSCSEGKTDS
jgi:hypothetical protein